MLATHYSTVCGGLAGDRAVDAAELLAVSIIPAAHQRIAISLSPGALDVARHVVAHRNHRLDPGLRHEQKSQAILKPQKIYRALQCASRIEQSSPVTRGCTRTMKAVNLLANTDKFAIAVPTVRVL